MAERGYWRKLRSSRLSRRALIRSSARAGVGLTALGLVGAAGSVAQPQNLASAGDTRVKRPVYGGVRRSPLAGTRSADPPTLDPFASGDELTQLAASYHYSRLMTNFWQAEALPADTCSFWRDTWQRDGVAHTLEIPDVITFIFELVDGAGWHDVAPADGRPVTVEDVQGSLEYLLTQHEQSYWWADEFWSSEILDPRGRKDLLIELQRPNTWVLDSVFTRDLWVAPQEIIADGTIAQRPIGSGPWVFDGHERFEELRWRRNLAWHPEVGRSLPFMDAAVATLNGDPQVLLEDLAAGRLDMSEIPASLYRDVREAAPHLEDFGFTPETGLGGFFFNHSSPPWNDPRVRIALSRALDRDRVLAETDPTGRGEWHSGLPVPQLFRLDPRDLADFGEQFEGADSGINFQHDPAGAQSLLEAAGYDDGIEATLQGIGPADAGMVELYQACVRSVGESGFRFRLRLHESAPSGASLARGRMLEDWLSNVADNQQNQVGIGPLSRRIADPYEILRQVYGGDRYLDQQAPDPPPAAGSPGADTRLQDLIVEQRGLLDWDKLRSKLHDTQRYLATQMYVVPYPAPPIIHAFQPWLEQWRRRRPWPETHFQFCQPAYWIDEKERQEFEERSDPLLFARSKAMREDYVTWLAPPIWASNLYRILWNLHNVRFIKVKTDSGWRGYSPYSDLPGRRDFRIQTGAELWLGR